MALMVEVPAAKREGQRRLLALDGGGIRGALTLEVLARLEDELRGDNGASFVLADYFDYFGGTSTGAISAAALALGWPVSDLTKVYEQDGEEIFKPVSKLRWFLSLFRAKYGSAGLKNALQRHFGQNTQFGDASFRSLLLAVVHNSKTQSPWPLSNNPNAMFNGEDDPECNNRFPLWQIVRASAAAPLFFPPESISRAQDGGEDNKYLFVDGGVTPSNNPSLQLFLQATVPQYRLGWETGPEKMLVVSVGTGLAPLELPRLTKRKMNAIHTARTLPGTFMNGSSVQQDIVCRVIGDCLYGPDIDAELGSLISGDDRATKQFSYLRYNATLSSGGMIDLGLPQFASNRDLGEIRALDAVHRLEDLRAIGRAVADQQVRSTHFDGFR